MRAVATRLLGAPEQANASFAYGVAETWHSLAEAVNGQIEVWWPNFFTHTGGGATTGCADQSPGSAATGTAQITYTSAATGNPVTVNMTDKTGGTTALSAANGGWFKAVASINAAAGSIIYPRIAGNFPSGVLYSLAKADLGAFDATHRDRFAFSASPYTLGAAIVDTFPSYRTWYGPMLIAAMGAKPTFAIVGDSREDGLTDIVSDSTGAIGPWSRLLAANGLASVNLAGRGETVQQFASNASNARRRDLLPYASFLALAGGINDFTNSNRTAAQVMTDKQTIITNIGKTAILSTVNPYQGNDKAARITHNTAIRALSAYVDPAIVLESTVTPGTWSNDDAAAFDLLHESNLGNAYGAANCAIVGTSLAVHGLAPHAAGAVYPALPNANLFAKPRDVNDAAWTKNATTIVTGQADDMAQNTSQKLQETTAAAQHKLSATASPLAVTAGTWEYSVDVAPGGRDWMLMYVFNQDFSVQGNVWFNLATGAVGSNYFSVPAALAFVSASNTAIVGTGAFRRALIRFTIGASVTSLWPILQSTLGDTIDNNAAGDPTKGLLMRPKMRLYKVS